MANTFITYEEFTRQVTAPYLEFIRKDLLARPLKEGEERIYPGLFGCMPIRAVGEKSRLDEEL